MPIVMAHLEINGKWFKSTIIYIKILSVMVDVLFPWERNAVKSRYNEHYNTNEFSASSNVSQSIWCKHLEHLLLRDPTRSVILEITCDGLDNE